VKICLKTLVLQELQGHGRAATFTILRPERVVNRTAALEKIEQSWMQQRLTKSLRLLLIAAKYVETSQCERCQMAIRFQELSDAGIEITDCRWLLIGGLVEHFTETTYPGDMERSFRNGDAILNGNSCFMLTPSGADYVAEFLSELESGEVELPKSQIVNTPPVPPAAGTQRSCEPNWDSQRQELWYAGKLVKQYRIPSPNQVAILSAFEEESWPSRIDDPLPQHFEIDPRRRLNDTIRNLNRSRITPLIRFSGDGSGQGILWEPERETFRS
jgi:hypothetical protein